MVVVPISMHACVHPFCHMLCTQQLFEFAAAMLTQFLHISAKDYENLDDG